MTWVLGENSLKLGRHSHSNEAVKYKQCRRFKLKLKWQNLKVQAVVIQAALQAAKAAEMAPREANARPDQAQVQPVLRVAYR